MINSNFINALQNKANLTLTENGAKAFVTTNRPCVDLFASIGAWISSRSFDLQQKEIVKRSYAANKIYTLSIVLNARDIRTGIGNRTVTREILVMLINDHPEDKDVLFKAVKALSELGRWDDLFNIAYSIDSTEFKNRIYEYIKITYDKDLISDHPSLLGKWAPSANTSSLKTRSMAKEFIAFLKCKPSVYRRNLVKLRKKIKIVENNLRTKDYSFDYQEVPSKAMKKYRKAFQRNDETRYNEFLNKVQKGEAKINTATLTPFDVVEQYLNYYGSDGLKNLTEDEKKLANAQWKNLPDVFGDNGIDALVACDVSGSMYDGYKSIACSLGLTLYLITHNKNEKFKNCFIDFCGDSRFHNLDNMSKESMEDVYNILNYVIHSSRDVSTNIESVYKSLLYGLKHSKDQTEAPKYLIIISDMQFNAVQSRFSNETPYQKWKRIIENAGYKMPTVIYWCTTQRDVNFAATSDENVIFVSGRSANVMTSIINIDKMGISDNTELSVLTMLDTIKNYAKYFE